jgi:hypothetical protein
MRERGGQYLAELRGAFDFEPAQQEAPEAEPEIMAATATVWEAAKMDEHTIEFLLCRWRLS